MPPTPVEVQIGGRTYRLVASAEESELRRLVSAVDEKLQTLGDHGQPVPPQAFLLAAIALAHDLEQERAQRRLLESRVREVLVRVLARIDSVVGQPAGAPDGSPCAAHASPEILAASATTPPEGPPGRPHSAGPGLEPAAPSAPCSAPDPAAPPSGDLVLAQGSLPRSGTSRHRQAASPPAR